jgi:hypothetical protein
MAAKKKKRLVAKKKAKISDAYIRGELRDFTKRTEERYEGAKTLYDAQDERTRGAVDRMVQKMIEMAGEPVATIKNGKVSRTVKVDVELQEKNFFYIAMRIMVGMAQWDIRVANFVLPGKKCAICQSRVRGDTR